MKNNIQKTLKKALTKMNENDIITKLSKNGSEKHLNRL